LRARGLTHAALSGYGAQGNARPDSDTDKRKVELREDE
jgi:hypothetical protein